MREDTQAGAHVELPDDVGRSVVLEDLLPIRTTVLAVAETLRVEGPKLALGGDVVQPVPFHVRRTRRRRQQELPQAALHSRGHVLPEERAIRRAKGHEHAALVLKGGVQVPAVVGSHVDRIAGNHGTAERVLSQLDAPDDVPSGSRIPVDRRITRLGHGGLGSWRDGRRGHDGRDDGLFRLDASDAIQRPLGFVTQCGIARGRSQRLPGRLCLRPDASQRAGREDAHIQEFILQSFNQLWHSGLRGGADAGEGLTCRPSDAGNRIAHGPGEVRGRRGRLRTDGRQGFRRVDADVRFLVRESRDQSAYRRTGLRAQGAQGTCGIARNVRILVSQCPSQRRLNRFGMGCQVNQGISGAAPDGDTLVIKEVQQQRHGRRTDSPDDFQRPRLQVFIVEESSQQWQRTPRPLDQGGFGDGADLRVPGGQAIRPLQHHRGVRGKIRTLGLARLRECMQGVSERWYRQNTKQRADEQVSHRRARSADLRSCSEAGRAK